ncbi:unnamed protein product [Durusdinium trenchii]|uniref:Ubiquitin-like domain-containing protein n=1 Tax=Durusdinium trenchii TaxID=1381693 RepID=A0ABP0QAY2_9DINO
MLQIRVLSGALAAELQEDDLGQVVHSVEPVRALKEYLAVKVGVPRFRQRLFRENLELQDEDLVTLRGCVGPLDWVILDFQVPEAAEQLSFASACRKGLSEKIEMMLQAPYNPNIYLPCARCTRTPLQLASRYGHLKVVQKLLEAGAEEDAATRSGRTALHMASEAGHLEVVRQLLEAGASEVAAAQNGSTALHWASRNGHLEVVQELLQVGFEKEAVAENGQTALHLASARGQLEVVRELLKAGAEKDAVAEDGSTALLKASQNEHWEVVELLAGTLHSKDVHETRVQKVIIYVMFFLALSS